MIHPHTELRRIDDTVGYGVFATRDLPAGTITYVKDTLELVVTPTDYILHDEEMRAVVDKYSYIDERGNRIVSWDFAKYVNHCCNCNSMSTGYGFEIAIRDIRAGEQITDEYGIFNLDEEMDLVCSQVGCRRRIGPSDFDNYYREWDAKILKALPHLFDVDQPLLSLVDHNTKAELEAYRRDPERYKSVYTLRYRKPSSNGVYASVPQKQDK